MPNIVTHIAVTAESIEGASTDILLGSVVPDFIGMYRDFREPLFRLAEAEMSMPIQYGMTLHHETDSVFDGLPERLDLVGSLTDDLEEDAPELPRGTVRALSSVGTDILLDGETLHREGAEERFVQLSRAVLSGKARLREDLAVSPVEEMAKDYFQQGVPYRYQDPEFVATMMFRRLEARASRHMPVDNASLPAVAQAFEAHIERLQKIAPAILDRVVDVMMNPYD